MQLAVRLRHSRGAVNVIKGGLFRSFDWSGKGLHRLHAMLKAGDLRLYTKALCNPRVSTSAEFEATFATLRALFTPYKRHFIVVVDRPGKYYLASKTAKTASGAAIWFGGAGMPKRNCAQSHRDNRVACEQGRRRRADAVIMRSDVRTYSGSIAAEDN